MSDRRRRRSTTSPDLTSPTVVGPSDPCPCGEPAAYGDHCGHLHAGFPATNPVDLMRSRYSAFVVHDRAHLLRTWACAQRPDRIDVDPDLHWTGLEIVGSTGGSAFHPSGTVEFRARFERHGRAGVHEENSLFVREGGRWVYDRALRPGE